MLKTYFNQPPNYSTRKGDGQNYLLEIIFNREQNISLKN
jgi:hypothetical protein